MIFFYCDIILLVIYMNSYKDFEEFLEKLDHRPKLLLHSCCGPCSSSVLELLVKYFDIDVLYYNPNIFPEEEFIKRKNEQAKLLKKLRYLGLLSQVLLLRYEFQKSLKTPFSFKFFDKFITNLLLISFFVQNLN